MPVSLFFMLRVQSAIAHRELTGVCPLRIYCRCGPRF